MMVDREMLEAIRQMMEAQKKELSERMDAQKKELSEMMEAQKKELSERMDAQKKELSEMMDAKLKPIHKHLDSIDERLETLEESQEEIRSGVNSLLEWAEECGNVIKFPLPKVK